MDKPDKRILDLSHEVKTGMPIYPGDKPSPAIEQTGSDLSEDITLSSFHLGSHFGTHMDAPRHFFRDGKTLLDFSVEQFVGSALCIQKQRDSIKPISLLKSEEQSIIQRKPDWLLICTGFDQYWEKERYFANHPNLSMSLIEFLLVNNIVGIGCDFPSIDVADAEKNNFPIHHRWLGADRLVIENLCNLIQLPTAEIFQLCALPLKMATDGSPARVVAIV